MNDDLEMMDSEPEMLTRDQLIEKLSEIRAHAHYVYALLGGLPKENFYIRRIYDLAADINVEDDDDNCFSLQGFLRKCNTMHPKDPFYIILKVEKKDGDVAIEELEENVMSYCDYSHFEDMSLVQVKNDVNEFLESFCEKCLRQNRPFYLTPETVHKFGFTEEDVKILRPLLERFNKEAKIRIRKEYDELAGLDFIRNNEEL